MEATPIEERRLALEERRVVAEENRLNQEIKWGWITRLGVAIPLVILVATLFYNGWEFSRAADADRDRDRAQANADRDRDAAQAVKESERLLLRARIDGQLAILNILLNQESPQQAYDKALLLDELNFSQDVGGEPLAPYFAEEAGE